MMSGRLVVATGLLGVIAGATAAGCWWRHAIQPPASQWSSAAVVDDLRAEIAQLRGELAATKARAALRAITETVVEARVTEHREPAPVALLGQDPGTVTVRLSAEELLRRTEEQFRSEGTDPVWSGPAEITARRQLSPSATRVQGQVQVECRATICRAEVTFPDAAQYERVADAASTETYEWTGGRATAFPSRTPDGKVMVTHYLFRDGEDPQRDIYAEEEARAAASHAP